MKVLHLSYDDPKNPWVAGGGAARLFEIYRELGGRVDATIVSGNYPGARDEVIEGVRYRRLGAARPYAWSRLSYGVAASRLLRRCEYDAAALDFSVYTPVRIPRDRAVGVVVHHLTAPTAPARWGRVVGGAVGWAERRMLRRARIVSLDTRVVLEEVQRLVPPDTPLELVGVGVSEAFFRVERREADYLLFFGRLDVFQKGLDTLLEAYARLRRGRPDLPLLIAGRGKDAAALEARARELGVAEGTRFLGAVSDDRRLELLAGARLLLMPSRFEGFGMVAAEAMAAGVPLVASTAGSLPEVVDPPRGGVLVPPEDPAALADAAAALLDEPERRARLSATARESARRFRWDAVAERHLRFLERVAANS